jgi:hypothetical protein
MESKKNLIKRARIYDERGPGDSLLRNEGTAAGDHVAIEYRFAGTAKPAVVREPDDASLSTAPISV